MNHLELISLISTEKLVQLENLENFSFFSHHLQTMEGGMITCKKREDYDYLKSLRAHG